MTRSPNYTLLRSHPICMKTWKSAHQCNYKTEERLVALIWWGISACFVKVRLPLVRIKMFLSYWHCLIMCTLNLFPNRITLAPILIIEWKGLVDSEYVGLQAVHCLQAPQIELNGKSVQLKQCVYHDTETFLFKSSARGIKPCSLSLAWFGTPRRNSFYLGKQTGKLFFIQRNENMGQSSSSIVWRSSHLHFCWRKPLGYVI